MLQIQNNSTWKLVGLILISWLLLGSSFVSSKSTQNSLRSSNSISDVKSSFSSSLKSQFVLSKFQLSIPIVFRDSRCFGASVFSPPSFQPRLQNSAFHITEFPIFLFHPHHFTISSNYSPIFHATLFLRFLFSSFLSIDLGLAFEILFPRHFRSPFLTYVASQSAFSRFRLIYSASAAAVFSILSISTLPFRVPWISASFQFPDFPLFQSQFSLSIIFSFSSAPISRDINTWHLFILFGLQFPSTIFVASISWFLHSSSLISYSLLLLVYTFLHISTRDVLTNSLTRHRGTNALDVHVFVATFLPTRLGFSSLITYGDTCPSSKQFPDACSLSDQDPTHTSYFSSHLHKLFHNNFIFDYLHLLVYTFLHISTRDVLTNSLTRHRGTNALDVHVFVATFLPTRLGFSSLITYGDTCPSSKQAPDACSLSDQDPTHASYFSSHLHKPFPLTTELYSFFAFIFLFAWFATSHVPFTRMIQSRPCHHFKPTPERRRRCALAR